MSERGTPKYRMGSDIDLDEEEVHLSDGTRLTEQRAEQIGEEAAEEARRLTGRPSLSGGSTHSPAISFRIPEQLRDEVERIAGTEGTTPSALARRALQQYVDGYDDRSITS